MNYKHFSYMEYDFDFLIWRYDSHLLLKMIHHITFELYEIELDKNRLGNSFFVFDSNLEKVFHFLCKCLQNNHFQIFIHPESIKFDCEIAYDEIIHIKLDFSIPKIQNENRIREYLEQELQKTHRELKEIKKNYDDISIRFKKLVEKSNEIALHQILKEESTVNVGENDIFFSMLKKR